MAINRNFQGGSGGISQEQYNLNNRRPMGGELTQQQYNINNRRPIRGELTQQQHNINNRRPVINFPGGGGTGSYRPPMQRQIGDTTVASNQAPGGGPNSPTSFNFATGGAGGGNALTGGRPLSSMPQNNRPAQPYRPQQPIQSQPYKLPQNFPGSTTPYIPQGPINFPGSTMPQNFPGSIPGGNMNILPYYPQQPGEQFGRGNEGTWGGQGSPYFNPGDYGVMPGNMGW
ncbi:MAG: hypothetical protein WC756_21700 [Taibaiella sp.]|jgi:hypothetical protein